jgi:hypothetical protein
VLALDAFSSDAIPVHLLTAEAFEVYFRHLKPGGILTVHISNRYLDLKPVLKEAAARFGKDARIVEDESNDEKGTYGTTWVLFADSAAAFEQPCLKASNRHVRPFGLVDRRLQRSLPDPEEARQPAAWDGIGDSAGRPECARLECGAEQRRTARATARRRRGTRLDEPGPA